MGRDDDRERDNRSGRYTTEYKPEAFIEAVEKLGLASTRDVADEVGCSYDLAYRRLKELADEGNIEGNKIGNTYHWKPKQ
jgi:predicted HTH transcriptional regulator